MCYYGNYCKKDDLLKSKLPESLELELEEIHLEEIIPEFEKAN